MHQPQTQHQYRSALMLQNQTQELIYLQVCSCQGTKTCMQSTQPPRKLFSIPSLADLGVSNGQSPETIRSLELMNVQKSQAFNLRIPSSSALMTQLQKTTSSQTMMTSVLLRQTDGKSSGDWEMPGPKAKQHLMFTLAEKRRRLSSAPSTTVRVSVAHRQVFEEQTA